MRPLLLSTLLVVFAPSFLACQVAQRGSSGVLPAASVAPVDSGWRSQPPEPLAISQSLSFPHVAQGNLPSGLAVYHVQKSALPLVHVTFALRAGAAKDPNGRAGLAHLVAELLRSGSKTYPRAALAEAIEDLGTTLNIDVTEEATSLHATLLPELAPRFLALLADIVSSPSFLEEEFNRIRKQQLAYLQMGSSSPVYSATRNLRRVLYGTHPYNHLPAGSAADLQATALSDLVAFHTAHYQPQQAALVVVGDVDFEQVQQWAQQSFGSWQPKAAPPLAATGALAQPGNPELSLLDKPKAPQTYLLMGMLGTTHRDAELAGLLLLDSVFGGLFNSRIMLNLREDKGYTYGVRSSLQPLPLRGVWSVSTSVRNDVAIRSIQEILAEIQSLNQHEVSGQELAMARNWYRTHLPAAFATVESAASTLTGLFVNQLPADFHAQLLTKMEAITPADVQRLARERLKPEAFSITVVGDAQLLKGELLELERGAPVLRTMTGERL